MPKAETFNAVHSNLQGFRKFIFLVLAGQALMPYGVLSTTLIIYFVTEILLFSLSNKKITPKEWLFFVGQVAFFVLLALSIFYSNDKGAGFRTILKGLPLLLFPLSSMLADGLSNQQYGQILKTYSISTAALGIYLCAYLLTHYDWDYVFSGSLVYHATKSEKFYLDVHPTLTSMHFLLGSLISLHVLKDYSSRRWTKGIFLMLLPIYFFAIVIFSSKYILMMFFIVVLAQTWIYFTKSLGQRLLLIGFFGVLIFGVFQSETITNKFLDFWRSLFLNNSGYLQSSTNIRKALFICWRELIANNFFFGFGVGTELPMLEKCLEGQGVKDIVGAHNYFVRLWLTAGFLSVVALIYSIYSNVKIHYRSSQKIVYFMMTLAFVGVMMIEDYLSRAYGIALYGFMNHLLYLQEKERKI